MAQVGETNQKKITTLDIRSRKVDGTTQKKIAVMTAYDYSTAKLVDELLDVVLVGDSVGMVFQGEPTTLQVTVDQMVYHARAVAKALRHAHLVADMPFMSYQTGWKAAVTNAGRLLAEGRAESVKLEGGVRIAKTVEKLVATGIPVMGHIGLTPQSVHAFGGYRVQGKTDRTAHAIVQDAVALEDAGAYAVVLEGMPSELGETITRRLKIPTIGIGAGPACDGQVLVSHDLLGLFPDFKPKFAKRYAQLSEMVRAAVGEYVEEVRAGKFPDAEHSF